MLILFEEMESEENQTLVYAPPKNKKKSMQMKRN
jgi:hypothetical protein